jgi:hypothetical protein
VLQEIVVAAAAAPARCGHPAPLHQGRQRRGGVMKTRPPIAVIGNANLDLVGGLMDDWPEQGTETFLDRADSRIGGSAANTALVLQRLGARAGLIASAGGDLVGHDRGAVRGPLDRIARVPGPSSVTFGLLHPGSERTFFSTPGHLDRLRRRHLAQGLDGWPLDGRGGARRGQFRAAGPARRLHPAPR